MKPIRRIRLSRAFLGLLATLVMLLGAGITGISMAPSASADSSTAATSAVTWAEARLGQSIYDGLCLEFVNDAYASAGISIGSSASAVTYWNAHTAGRNTDTNPPVGALVFWGATTTSMGYGLVNNPDGHVALSIGGGSVISSYERSNHTIHEFSIASRNAAHYPYLGWMMPPGVTAPSAGGGATGSGVGNAIYDGSGTFSPGTTLYQNHYVLSPDAKYVLMMQWDGNLVLRGPGYSSIWSSGTVGTGAVRASFQSDGNFVLYNSGGGVVWASATNGASAMTLQDDGNFVIRGSSVSWATNTGGHTAPTYVGSGGFAVNQSIYLNQYLRSPDGRYVLVFQSDGNLVLYSPGYHVLWANGALTADRLTFQSDGNLVMFKLNNPVWATASNGATRAVLQDDGNFVLYNGNTVVWATNTGGMI